MTCIFAVNIMGYDSVLESLVGTISPTSPNGPGPAADRLSGLLACTLGNLETAAAHFEAETASAAGGLPA